MKSPRRLLDTSLMATARERQIPLLKQTALQGLAASLLPDTFHLPVVQSDPGHGHTIILSEGDPGPKVYG